jgi:hypothetical protein
LFKLRPP